MIRRRRGRLRQGLVLSGATVGVPPQPGGIPVGCRLQVVWRLALGAVVIALGSAGDAGAVGAPSRAQAREFAAAVSLTAGDLPGFTASTKNPAPVSDLMSSSPCQTRPGRRLARMSSPFFEHQNPDMLDVQLVASRVTVWASAHEAARRLAATGTARVRRCLERELNRRFQALKRPGVSYGHAVLSLRSPPASPSGDSSIGLRIKVRISVSGLSVPLYLDIFGFTLGRAGVNLLAEEVAAPFPAAEEQRLFALLVARATARRL